MKTEQLALTEPQPLAVNPSTGALIAAVIQSGVTSANVDVIERLVALKEREEIRDAERQFTSAFVKMQKELPTIVARTEVKNRGKYEKFEDVMEVVGPILRANGFSESFSQTATDSRITVTCHLCHIAGHSKPNSFSVRVGKADTETQADCKASTTAKRNALLQALNIVIRQDFYQSDEADATTQDGGETVDAGQAADLHAIFDEVKANVDTAAFWTFCGVDKFRDIPAVRFEEIAAMLNRKRK